MNKQPFDFPEEHRDAEAFLSEPYSRQLMMDDVFSPDNMSDSELRESIIDDILAVTMWEIQTGDKLSFDFQELVRFCPDSCKERIKNQLTNFEVAQFLIVEISTGQMRIYPEHKKLQKAMDFCGTYYSGFKIPEEEMLVVNHGVIRKEANMLGGIPAMMHSFIMDLRATHPSNNTIH